jgi:hydrogenase-4 component F
MLSAGLLNTGMYAIIRFQALTVPRLGSGYAGCALLIFGFASVVVGALFIVLRGNFKRMFAYSSVEQMGIIAIALGFGGVLGFYGALLQILTHAVAKAVLFLTSGDLVLRYRTRLIDEVRGVLSVAPLTGAILVLAALAVGGSPPFGLFLSEFTIVRAGLNHSSVVLVAALLVLLAIVFVALIGAVSGMTFGPAPDRPTAGPAYAERSGQLLAATPLVAGLGLLLMLGLWIPDGLDTLIMQSIHVIR